MASAGRRPNPTPAAAILFAGYDPWFDQALAFAISGGCLTRSPSPAGGHRDDPRRGAALGTRHLSCDGRFALDMQFDGNLVLYQVGIDLHEQDHALRATGTTRWTLENAESGR